MCLTRLQSFQYAISLQPLSSENPDFAIPPSNTSTVKFSTVFHFLWTDFQDNLDLDFFFPVMFLKLAEKELFFKPAYAAMSILK